MYSAIFGPSVYLIKFMGSLNHTQKQSFKIKWLLTESFFSRTSKSALFHWKTRLNVIPVSQGIVQHLASVDFHDISYWKTSSVHSKGNMHPPTVSNAYPEGGHYFMMWYVQMPTCNDPPQDGLLTVFWKWTLLFSTRSQDLMLFMQIAFAFASYHVLK